MIDTYDSSNIIILKGLDAVKKRPGMYIGNTDDGSGLHQMIFELVDNSIDEGLAGYCSYIKIILHKDFSVTVKDNGRGIPVGICENENKSAAEIIMTVLHSGGKFDDKSYNVSGGLHGVGVSVVNALSEELSLKIFKNGFKYEQLYKNGFPISNISVIDFTTEFGTEIKFYPNYSILKKIEFNYNILFSRFKELSYLNTGIKIELVDERYIKKDICFKKDGVKEYLLSLNTNYIPVNIDIIHFFIKKKNISLNIVMQWINSHKENIYCYTNSIFQKNGGTHLVGLKNALTKVFKLHMDPEILKKNKIIIIGDDTRNGLVCILSLKIKNPKFSSQVKDKLVSSEAKHFVENSVFSEFRKYLCKNSCITKLISAKILSSAKIREAIKKTKDLAKKKDALEFLNLPGKLSDCREYDPKLSELFLVEGDSAGGSAKQARDRETQAILPLKGKILNVEKATFDKILSSSEINSLTRVLNCDGISKKFNINKLRYHKIILMTDADVDGSHIRTLLLTFFYRKMPEIIKNGYLYISRPPLYRLQKFNDISYFRDEKDMNKFLFKLIHKKLVNIFSRLVSKFKNINLLKSILNLYKDILFIINKYPSIFVKNLIIFKYDLNTHNLNQIFEKLELFINKDKKFNNKIVLHLENKNLYVSINNYGMLEKYEINLENFLIKDYLILRKIYKYISKLFSNIDCIYYNKKKYNINNFIILIDILKIDLTKSYKIQRYKGLGEMNPMQLWDTTMNPKTRILSLVKIKDTIYTDKLFSILMGNNINDRKKLIENHSLNNFKH